MVQRESSRLPNRKRHIKFARRDSVLLDLAWWQENAHQHSPIYYPPPSIFITTDAADTGWGAVVNGRRLCGTWTLSQQNWHSNKKELWPILEVLRQIELELEGKSVTVQTDNRTSVADVMKQGVTKSLTLLETAASIMEICQKRR
ncbi:uncharacterized protein LOC132904052 [Amyelois transitella]|uniref:uncharacterized protein LOC132904052 n=1 Tax=Amyelois transitella TaxID=680683 RepID=UPI00298F42F4|nr:uncharacterized protein LOC132904052 [Amyelois transitella]